ncbi:MAG: hypothetical protein SFU83_22205 [Meiothermus sp.]|nr:hypothetical protein [Meiothermus sp.]
MLKVALVGMVVTCGAALLMLWPTPLDVNLNQPTTQYQAHSGPHHVAFRLLRETATGDNGLVQIEVSINGRVVRTLPAAYSYDTLMHQPAGQFRWLWLDGDLWPDVQLEPNGLGGASAYYIGSRDGGFYVRGSR